MVKPSDENTCFYPIMAMLLGLLLFMLGAVATYAWRLEVVPILKGLLALSLLFWGLIALVVAYSEKKARREYVVALDDELGGDENPAPVAEKTPLEA